VTFDDGSPYGYGVQQSRWRNGSGNVVQEFVTSARKHNISPGIYYSLDSNFYLSVDTPTTATGQRRVSRKEFQRIMLGHLEELWGSYGPLGELWFDGKDPFDDDPAFQARVAQLASRLQPHAILLDGPHLREYHTHTHTPLSTCSEDIGQDRVNELSLVPVVVAIGCARRQWRAQGQRGDVHGPRSELVQLPRDARPGRLQQQTEPPPARRPRPLHPHGGRGLLRG
jgi:hypothetical protein